MIDFNKIKKWNEAIKRNKEKLNKELDFKKKEVLKLRIKLDEIKIQLERIN
jgi:hypothetical protein